MRLALLYCCMPLLRLNNKTNLHTVIADMHSNLWILFLLLWALSFGLNWLRLLSLLLFWDMFLSRSIASVNSLVFKVRNSPIAYRNSSTIKRLKMIFIIIFMFIMIIYFNSSQYYLQIVDRFLKMYHVRYEMLCLVPLYWNT